MGVYLGDSGRVLLGRDESHERYHGVIRGGDPATGDTGDVNPDRRRLSVLEAAQTIISGDYVQIYTAPWCRTTTKAPYCDPFSNRCMATTPPTTPTGPATSTWMLSAACVSTTAFKTPSPANRTTPSPCTSPMKTKKSSSNPPPPAPMPAWRVSNPST